MIEHFFTAPPRSGEDRPLPGKGAADRRLYQWLITGPCRALAFCGTH